MYLKIRDVAEALHVPEKAVLRWVHSEGMPATNASGEYRFNILEVVEWVARRPVNLPAQLLPVTAGENDRSLAAALERGGILTKVASRSREDVVHQIVQALLLPAAFSTDPIEQVFASRGDLGLRSVGDGIAIPHASTPIILPDARPALTLCFLDAPLTLAADAQADALFVLVSPTVRLHLVLLMHLACALHDLEFRDLVKRRAAPDHIFRAAHRLQAGMTTADCFASSRSRSK